MSYSHQTRTKLLLLQISYEWLLSFSCESFFFHLSCVSPGTVGKSITCWKWKSVDIASVQSDMSGAIIDFSPHDISSAIGFYNNTLADIVEKHAPQKLRVLTIRADKPWYKTEMSAEKRLRRKCERKYKNTQLESDKSLLKEQRNKCNNLLNSTKKDYIKNNIENAQSSKDLYNICDKLLNPKQISVWPSHDCATSLANTFVDYFKNRIELIRSDIEEALKYNYWSVTIHCPHISWIIFWIVVSESDVRKVITPSPTKNLVLLTLFLHGY